MLELRAQYLDDNATDGSGEPGTPAELGGLTNPYSNLPKLFISASVVVEPESDILVGAGAGENTPAPIN